MVPMVDITPRSARVEIRYHNILTDIPKKYTCWFHVTFTLCPSHRWFVRMLGGYQKHEQTPPFMRLKFLGFIIMVLKKIKGWILMYNHSSQMY